MSSNTTTTYPSCFIWVIHPPFISGQTMKAEFHQETPTVAKWHVKLRFEEIRIGEWEFALYLTFDNRGNESVEIVVQRLVIRICYNRDPIVEKIFPRYKFNVDNAYTFHFSIETSVFAQMEPHQLVLEIGTSLEEDSETFLLPFHDDLMCLAKDLSSLSVNPRFHNVDLHADGQIVFRAHSYILSVRWNKLFQWPPSLTAEKTVLETNISSYLLRHLLMYMYAGVFIGGFPHWGDPAYISELFQVIKRYDLNHLKDGLVQSDASQIRVSKRFGFTTWFRSRLRFINYRLVNDSPLDILQEFEKTVGYTNNIRCANNNKEYDIIFQISAVNTGGSEPWLSYTVVSKTDFWVCVQVNLEVLEMGVGRNHQMEVVRKIPSHANTYSICPNESKRSGPVLFLGCLATFGDFLSEDNSGYIQLWLRFKICVTDGSSVEEIRSLNIRTPSNKRKYNVLMNDMYQLMSKEIHADMRLVSHPRYKDDVQTFCRVHRAIIATRIPRLHGVVIGIQPGDHLPEVATVDLSAVALPHVVEYIYTGKIGILPEQLLDEISDFAHRGNFQSLSNLINSRRENQLRLRIMWASKLPR